MKRCTWCPDEATHELIRYSDEESTDPRATEPIREYTNHGCDAHTAQNLGPLSEYDEVLPLMVVS